MTPLNQREPEDRAGSFADMIQVSSDLNIVADGPLSQMFTACLNKLYAKEVDPATGLALESQALDAQTTQTLWTAYKMVSDRPDVGMLYGVWGSEAKLNDVVRVADVLGDMTGAELANSAVIIMADPEPIVPVEAVQDDQGKIVDFVPHEPTVVPDASIDPPLGVGRGEPPAPVANPVVVTNERNASDGTRFQNFHFGDSLSRRTSPLYSNDNDFSVRSYRANNVFARSLQAVAEERGVKVYPSLEAYLDAVKKG